MPGAVARRQAARALMCGCGGVGGGRWAVGVRSFLKLAHGTPKSTSDTTIHESEEGGRLQNKLLAG